MKKEGSLKITLSILVIVLVTLVSIWGVYVKSGNTMKNILPDYEYGMELKNTNILNLEVKKEEASAETTEEKNEQNEEDVPSEGEGNSEGSQENQNEIKENIYTIENYKKAKNIIEKRFKIVDVNQYTIRLNEKTGNMSIELPTELSSSVTQEIFAKGKFEIKIADNDEVIANNESIQNIETFINNEYANVKDRGSIVELNFKFNKDAVKKFNEIKNTYDLTTTNEKTTSENEEGQASEETADTASGEIVDRNVTIYIDGESLFTSKLEDFLKYATNGSWPLTMGGYTNDKDALESALLQAKLTKSIILTENLPIEYTSSATTNIHSNISKESIIIVFAIIFAIMCAYLIFKKKLSGIYGALSIIGFISTLLLVIRFSNVALTISSIFAIALMMFLQFIYVICVLKDNGSKKLFNEKTVEFIKILIPVFIMSITISFAKVIELIGFGETVFWGLIVFSIFNNIITRAILTNVKNK